MVAASWAILLITFDSGDVVSNTHMTGGDHPGHLYMVRYLGNHLWDDPFVWEWMPDWYAGFPLYHFYFPLPAIMQVLLGEVLPFTIAYKLVVAAGWFLLPGSVYLSVRLFDLPSPAPGVAALATMGFLFMDSFDHFGGNVASTLRGEYAYAIGLAFAVISWGLSYRLAVDERARPVLTGTVLAGAALSHIIPVAVMIAGLPVLVMLSARRFDKREAARRFGAMAAVAAGLTSFWILPFVARLGFTSSRGLSPESISTAFPPDLVAVAAIPILLLVGLQRRDPRMGLLLLPAMVALTLFLVIGGGQLLNARVLPVWYLGTWVAAGCVTAIVITAAATRVGHASLMTIALAGLVGLVVVTQPSVTKRWFPIHFGGPSTTPAGSELAKLVETFRALPPGRVLWESSAAWVAAGTDKALSALPLSADQDVLEGVNSQGIATAALVRRATARLSPDRLTTLEDLRHVPFDPRAGLEDLRMLGVDYFVTASPRAETALLGEDGVDRVTGDGPFRIHRIAGGEDVVVLPSDEVRIDRDARSATVSAASGRSSGRVTDVAIDGARVSFSTTAPGRAHLVKASFFPTWRAEGGEGPFRTDGNLMVVFPTGSRLVLRQHRQLLDASATAISAASLAIVAWYGGLTLRRGRLKKSPRGADNSRSRI